MLLYIIHLYIVYKNIFHKLNEPVIDPYLNLDITPIEPRYNLDTQIYTN